MEIKKLKPEGNFLFLVNSLLVIRGTPIDPPGPPPPFPHKRTYLISLREKSEGRKRETEIERGK